jgi:hypothetical protein
LIEACWCISIAPINAAVTTTSSHPHTLRTYVTTPKAKQLGKTEVYELSYHTSRCLVLEIKVRASDQSTEAAAQSLADFLSEDGEFGALAIQAWCLGVWGHALMLEHAVGSHACWLEASTRAIQQHSGLHPSSNLL